MKDELKQNLLDDKKLMWELNGSQYEILFNTIDRFFSKYQPERSKREDPVHKVTEFSQESIRSQEDNVIKKWDAVL